MKKLIKVFVTIAIPCLAAWLVSVFLFQFLMIHGTSMAPTYRDKQIVLVDKRPMEYQKGDVVLLYSEGLNSKVVKRITACPGDTVVIRDKTLYINGVQSSMFIAGSVTYDGILANEIRLQEDEYIVLGDNLSESRDSRYEEVGIIQKKDIKGKLMW